MIEQDAFFLPLATGERFCIWRAPASGHTRGIVVHAPAFAEEMNKSRHVVAQCARGLAAQGFGVLQIDVHGCGDSSGDFEHASWRTWVDDIVAASDWARRRCSGPLWLWGLRAGALLASSALTQLKEAASLLLWQPVLSGKQHLMQFLRLGLASELVGARHDGRGTRALYDELAHGGCVEVAGYRLSSALAFGLANAQLSLPHRHVARVEWCEIGSAGADLPPAVSVRLADFRSKHIDVRLRSISGPGFWKSTELEDCPALVDASIEALVAYDCSIH